MRLVFTILFCCGFLVIFAQDPSYNNFYGNEAYFNPAMVGYRGALSFQTNYTNQWSAGNVRAYQNGQFTMEESMPCSIFDYGLRFGFDEEGQGLLRTIDIGFRLAGTAPFDIAYSRHNIRIGLGLQWSVKRIQFDRLVFSDQLNPIYGIYDRQGILNPTAFSPPNLGSSQWFFTPSAGFSHRILLNHTKENSGTLNYGAAIHNAFSIGQGPFTGHQESLLGIGTKIPVRYSLFAYYELVPIMKSNFISITPLVVTEFQQNLSYFYAGAKISYNRIFSVGVYYHTNEQPSQGTNSDWISLTSKIAHTTSDWKRLELGFSYSINTSGVRNHFNGIYAISLGIHLGSSPTCSVAGKENLIPYGSGVKCPTSLYTPGRGKIYENIWYK